MGKAELERLVGEALDAALAADMLNEGYGTVAAKSDLNTIGEFICGDGNVDRRTAADAYRRFMKRIWRKLEILS